jgi:hypothetical protein
MRAADGSPRRLAPGYARPMSAPDQSLKQQRAVLLILLATSERALEAFQVADNVIDETFVEDLERIIARTQKEIHELTKQMGEET